MVTEYIEREALMKKSFVWEGHRVVSFLDVIGEPAADVAPVRHLKWAFLGPDGFNRGWWGTCPGCGVRQLLEYKNYCPNCGAKMDGWMPGVAETGKINLQEEKIMSEKYYIVRAEYAGVFFGKIKDRTGDEVVMTDVRRLWCWDGAASLSQLAVEGVSRPHNCKFTVTVPEMTILGAIELIPCSEAAEANIKAVPVWRA